MIRQTRAATAQIEALFQHYLALGYDQAAHKLLQALSEALDRIEADPIGGRSHPGPYPSVACRGFRWIKVHRYWFGYAAIAQGVVVTNVIHYTADLPRRVEIDSTPDDA